MKPRKPFERKTSDFYAGEFCSAVDSKNRIFIPSNFERTLVHKNESSDGEYLEEIILHLKDDKINCYDHKYYSANKSRLDHSKLYVSNLDLQRRVLIPHELASKYSPSKKVSISASKDGEYFIIRSMEKKK